MMNKLEYDSFYKFLVSAGVILMTAPILGVCYLISKGGALFVSVAERQALSETAAAILDQRDMLLRFIFSAAPLVVISMFLLGIWLIYRGAKGWKEIQSELDKQNKLKTQEMRQNLKKLSDSEVVENVANDTVEVLGNEPVPATTQRDRVVKAMEIERLCVDAIRKEFSKNYDVRQNVRVENYGYDAVAVSERDNIDLLFDIKYWPRVPEEGVLRRVVDRVAGSGIRYETHMHRNFRCILKIVTPDNVYEAMQQACDAQLKELETAVRVECIRERDLV